jgi:hypothetical protein
MCLGTVTYTGGVHGIIQKLLSHVLSRPLKVKIHKQLCHFLVCEIQLLTLRERNKLQVFINKGLTRIFISEHKELSGQFRMLYKKEVCNLYRSPSIIRIVKSRRLHTMSWTHD